MKRATKYNFNRFAPKLLAGFIATSVMLASPVFALEETGIPAVGEVSLVLGKAYIEKPNGDRELVKVGTLINAKDRIETGSNGYVHIRFVDTALVSVRSSSQLEILRYDYNAASPQDSFVKLNLIEGVTRAISGEAAKAARENFRLDTPIAAIGVRGTDFVVRSNEDGVLAQVTEGAIVVAPYSAECSAAAFGPCSFNALEVAGGTNQIVQISANTNEAMLLSLAPLPVPEVPEESAQTAAVTATSEAKTKDGTLYTDSFNSKTTTHVLAVARTGISGAPPTAAPPIQQLPEFTPDVVADAATLTNKQLLWGRYADTGFERITVPFTTYNPDGSVSYLSDSRDTTVGNDVYALFRSNNGTGKVQPALPVLGFNLYQAQAILRVGGQSDLMNVTGGTLNIDFNQNLFSTSLQMNHAATGNIDFSESGRVFGGGIFHSSNSNGTPVMAGAVSLDGTQAGYFFEKTLESGVIEGLTLWGVKP